MSTIDISQLDSFLTTIVQSVEQPHVHQALTEWMQEWSGDEGEQFVSGVSPDGTPKAPLKRPRPQGHNQVGPPLIDFGDLMLSVISEAANHIEQITDDEAIVGTADPKAVYHQLGTSKMVARPFIGITDNQIERAAELIASQVIQTFGKAA